MLLWLWACTKGAEPVDSGCAEAPVLAWADFGEALLLEHCDSCHAAGAAERYGAPADVVFDTYEDVRRHRDRMLGVLEPTPRMPPAIPLPEPDLSLLVSWLRCDVEPLGTTRAE